MYTVKQVVAMTGLTAATLRIWERRYGVVTPRRTSSHYRMFSEADVARLRAMVQLVEAGATTGKAAEIVMSEALSEHASPEHAQDEPERLSELARQLDMEGLADLLRRTITVEDILWSIDKWMTPAVVELNERARTGELTRAHAHMAERAVKRRLGTLLDETRVLPAPGSAGPVRPLVLVGQEESGGHEMIPLSFTIALRRQKVDARYLGGAIGHDAWMAAAEQLRPRAIALAVSTPDGVDASQRLAADLAALRPPIAVWLGGPGVTPRRGVRGMLPMDAARSTRTVLNHLLAGSVEPSS